MFGVDVDQAGIQAWRCIDGGDMTDKEKRLVLESLKAHADEGFYLLGHYDSGATEEDAAELGRRLCLELNIPLEGRDWLK